MSMLINPHRFGDAAIYSMLQRLGLTTGLKLVVDAGDDASYPGSGQEFIDRTGNNNFYLGNSSGASGDDPTFNGTAGNLSESEYFSCNGSQDFRSVGDPTWADDWTENGSTYSAAFIFKAPNHSGGSFPLFAQLGGMCFGFDENEKVYLFDVFASMFIQTSNAYPVDAWSMAIFSGVENGGASGSFINLNGTVTTGDANIPSPYNFNTSKYGLAGNQGGSQRLPNGSGFAAAIAWDGVALTTTQASQLYNLVKATRFPSLP